MTFYRFRQILPFLGFLLLCASAVVFVDTLFVTEEGNGGQEITASEHDADYIEVNARLIGVDPIKENMTFRLDFVPHGGFDSGDGLLAVPLEAHMSSIGGESIQFEAGRRMFPHEVIIDMYEGEVEAYPFDKHSALFEILVVNEGIADASVPTQLNLYANHHGYKFSDQEMTEKSHNYLGYDLHMQRSTLVVGTVIFCMAIIWGLTIVNMFICWLAFKGKMEVNLGLFGYMSGFIVSLFFFRQIFPNVPPFLGVFSDYASFFWAELVAAGISIGLVVKWFHTHLSPVGETKKGRALRTPMSARPLAQKKG